MTIIEEITRIAQKQYNKFKEEFLDLGVSFDFFQKCVFEDIPVIKLKNYGDTKRCPQELNLIDKVVGEIISIIVELEYEESLNFFLSNRRIMFYKMKQLFTLKNLINFERINEGWTKKNIFIISYQLSMDFDPEIMEYILRNFRKDFIKEVNLGIFVKSEMLNYFSENHIDIFDEIKPILIKKSTV